MSSPTDKPFSAMTVRVRRRAIARRLERISKECDDFVKLELTFPEDIQFLDDKEQATLVKMSKALGVVGKNLQVLSGRIVGNTEEPPQ